MPDLPRPRDERERRCMTLAYEAGLIAGRREDRDAERLHARLQAESAVPPVSEASPEGMPELAMPWRVLDGNGVSVSGDDDRESVEAELRRLSDRNQYPNIPRPLRVVRLAVVEVVEPEPEQAPSGWRYDVRCNSVGWWTLRASANDGSWWAMDRPKRSELAFVHNVPPIDREHVARLLGGNDATA